VRVTAHGMIRSAPPAPARPCGHVELRAGAETVKPCRSKVQIQLTTQAVGLAEDATSPQPGRTHVADAPRLGRSVDDLHDARLPSRTAEAFTMVRRARAMRPCLPITMPTSSLATDSSSTTVVSVSVATRGLVWVVYEGFGQILQQVLQHPTTPSVISSKTYLFVDALDSEQPLHGARRLSALCQPFLGLVGIYLDERRLHARVVLSDGLDGATVTPRS